MFNSTLSLTSALDIFFVIYCHQIHGIYAYMVLLLRLNGSKS